MGCAATVLDPAESYWASCCSTSVSAKGRATDLPQTVGPPDKRHVASSGLIQEEKLPDLFELGHLSVWDIVLRPLPLENFRKMGQGVEQRRSSNLTPKQYAPARILRIESLMSFSCHLATCRGKRCLMVSGARKSFLKSFRGAEPFLNFCGGLRAGCN